MGPKRNRRKKRRGRKRFGNLFKLNMNDPRNFTTYTSIDMMKREQEIHRVFYPLRIHPHSRFRVFWETFYLGYAMINMIFLFFFSTISHFTYNHAAAEPGNDIFIADLPIIANIVFNFVTGFIAEGQKEASMMYSAIAKHYARTTFFFDLFGVILGSPLWNHVLSKLKTWRHPVLGGVLFVARALGISARSLSPWYYWRYNVSRYYLVDGLQRVIVEFFVIFPIMVSFFATIAYICNYYVDDTFKGGKTAQEAANIFMGFILKVWMSSDVIQNISLPITSIMNIIFVLLPYILYFIIITFLVLIFWSMKGSSEKYNALIDNLNEYMQLVSISNRLKIRIVQYYKETFGGNFYDEIALVDEVSTDVRDDIILLKLAMIKEEIIIFRMLPTEELILICTRLVKEMFFGNDVLAYGGSPTDRMYFIARGTVALYTDNATEIYHMPATTHILWRGIQQDLLPVIANYVACESTVVYSLSREDYNAIKRDCPVFAELYSFNLDLMVEVVEFIKEKDNEREEN